MAPYERVYNQPNDADTEVNAKGRQESITDRHLLLVMQKLCRISGADDGRQASSRLTMAACEVRPP